MLRIAINGYGRIGRCLVRALFERKLEQQIHLTAINDLGEQSTLAHLTRFDSTFGRFPGDISLDGDTLRVNGHPIQLLREREVTNLPWREHAVDLVLECTGKLKKRAQVTGGYFSDPGFKDVPEPWNFGFPIAEVAAEHGKSPAQVMVRWSMQLGNIVLPKSVTPERIEQNNEGAVRAPPPQVRFLSAYLAAPCLWREMDKFDTQGPPDEG